MSVLNLVCVFFVVFFFTSAQDSSSVMPVETTTTKNPNATEKPACQKCRLWFDDHWVTDEGFDVYVNYPFIDGCITLNATIITHNRTYDLALGVGLDGVNTQITPYAFYRQNLIFTCYDNERYGVEYNNQTLYTDSIRWWWRYYSDPPPEGNGCHIRDD